MVRTKVFSRIGAVVAVVAIAAGMMVGGCGKNDNQGNVVDSGTFTDPRDGQKYRTVKIGDKTWMAENLNFKADSSWCFDNDESNCRKYGRLYDWNTAMEACPAGWRLPSNEDWNDLVQAAGGDVAGKKLKSKTGWNENWNGTDEFGFSALPGGYRDTVGSFSNAGSYGYWWSATEYGSGDAYFRHMYCDYENMGGNLNDKGYGFPVRCVK